MAKKSPRRSALGKALIVGAILGVALPGIAYAATNVTARTPGATSGPGSANSVSSSTANCRTESETNDVVSGVGINQTIGTGTEQSNLHVKGMAPYNGSAEYIAANGFSTPGVVGSGNDSQSVAVGGTGGSMGGIDAAFSSTPYAMCLDPGGTVTSTQIIMNKVAGPTGAGGTDLAIATCPANTRLLGGGARTTPDNQGSLKPIVSYPTYIDGAHNNGHIAAGNNETNPTSWAAGALTGSAGMNNTTYAYAICSGNGINVGGVTVKVKYAQSNGPTTVGAPQLTTTGCGENDGTLISGGAGISGDNITTTDFTAPGAQGDHLNGSYPSDGSGNPVSNGTTTAAYWTSATHTGGGGSTAATRSHVWGLCMSGN